MISSTPHTPPSALRGLARLLRHRWADGGLHQTLPPDMLQRLGQRITASERRHTGQIRICVEGGLPLSYIWRGAGARERAITQFGKLRVWDTEYNNGVLIYLLLAEHAIEIVADRGLTSYVAPATWHTLVTQMRAAFRAGRYEDGLTQALSEVSALLVRYFPRDAAQDSGDRGNELPDAPVVAP
ncbi:TPM domain-containing protein [Alicycliphilus denitrificans]|uniref:TPM domain-containing protein n=1 Tax=Alicycliphilus denitrificans TaxID=179636 RepID=UPI00384F9E2B